MCILMILITVISFKNLKIDIKLKYEKKYNIYIYKLTVSCDLIFQELSCAISM